ncbi:unnamed protein product [Discosporangium mesarthrocarpum]
MAENSWSNFWGEGLEQRVHWCVSSYHCQARKTRCQTIRWPLFSLSLPSGPGQATAFSIMGPLTETQRGNIHIYFEVYVWCGGLVSRHCALFSLTAGVCNNILLLKHMPVWDYPHILLLDRGAQFTLDAYKLTGAREKFISTYHPMTDGFVERLNHTVSQP